LGAKLPNVIVPCLTYLDMKLAMPELGDLFGLEIVWLGDDAAEIRWDDGVAVAQKDQPELLHGSHVGHGWTYVRVADPDAHHAQARRRGARISQRTTLDTRRSPAQIQHPRSRRKHLDLRNPTVRTVVAGRVH
jgi:hypothetical protein